MLRRVTSSLSYTTVRILEIDSPLQFTGISLLQTIVFTRLLIDAQTVITITFVKQAFANICLTNTCLFAILFLNRYIMEGFL